MARALAAPLPSQQACCLLAALPATPSPGPHQLLLPAERLLQVHYVFLAQRPQHLDLPQRRLAHDFVLCRPRQARQRGWTRAWARVLPSKPCKLACCAAWPCCCCCTPHMRGWRWWRWHHARQSCTAGRACSSYTANPTPCTLPRTIRLLELLHRHNLVRLLVAALEDHAVGALAHDRKHLIFVHAAATCAACCYMLLWACVWGGAGRSMGSRRYGLSAHHGAPRGVSRACAILLARHLPAAFLLSEAVN